MFNPQGGVMQPTNQMALNPTSQPMTPQPQPQPGHQPGMFGQDDDQRRQMMAQHLMQQGGDGSPIQSPWQGINRMASGALGGYMQGQSGQAQPMGGGFGLGGSMLGGVQNVLGGMNTAGMFGQSPIASSYNNPQMGGMAGANPQTTSGQYQSQGAMGF